MPPAELASGPPRPDWLARMVDGVNAGAPWWLALRPAGEATGRPSAVLVLFGVDEHGETDVVLTERSANLRSHAGQVSFPGGRLDPQDGGSATAAALREASEEIGLSPEGVDIVAELPALYLRPTSSVVTPVLAWWASPTPISVIDPGEVARVVRAPLAELTDPARRFSVTHPSGYIGPAFDIDGLLVWGFTAGVLASLLDLAGLAPEWDPDRHQPLPERFVSGPRRAAQARDRR